MDIWKAFLHSHWRPIGGWICMAATALEVVLLPLYANIMVLVSHPVEIIHVDKVLLLELIAIFVTYRSFEKYHEVAAK